MEDLAESGLASQLAASQLRSGARLFVFFFSMTSCRAEPFVLLADDAACGESPLCTHIFCFRQINCLLASTLAPIIAGCRLDDKDVFCVCPTVHLPLLRHVFEMSQLTTSTAFVNATIAAEADAGATEAAIKKGISGGAIAGIVIGCLVGVVLLAAVAFFTFRYLRDRRKNHGEYRPQFEEQHHAKDLPYLQPPNIEGLI
ncbi:unnamed protein product [Caenorhabditis auriculariae]|uniref:Uncharacterized protein n=1 Tax=Caenorhabditis auriculariae TaxID=2777116 RepID=A0A8S1H152_9PELO|nr:unnamed protein product [Caenorhabditis auriculariae]